MKRRNLATIIDEFQQLVGQLEAWNASIGETMRQLAGPLEETHDGRRRISAAGRRRIAEAQRARWAAKRKVNFSAGVVEVRV